MTFGIIVSSSNRMLLMFWWNHIEVFKCIIVFFLKINFMSLQISYNGIWLYPLPIIAPNFFQIYIYHPTTLPPTYNQMPCAHPF